MSDYKYIITINYLDNGNLVQDVQTRLTIGEAIELAKEEAAWGGTLLVTIIHPRGSVVGEFKGDFASKLEAHLS